MKPGVPPLGDALEVSGGAAVVVGVGGGHASRPGAGGEFPVNSPPIHHHGLGSFSHLACVSLIGLPYRPSDGVPRHLPGPDCLHQLVAPEMTELHLSHL